MLRGRCLSHLMDIYSIWPLMGNFYIWTHSGLLRTGSLCLSLLGCSLIGHPCSLLLDYRVVTHLIVAPLYIVQSRSSLLYFVPPVS